MIYRKCEACRCSLDPGEGKLCEECKEEEQEKRTREKALKNMILCKDYYQMSLEEFINGST